MRQPDQPGATAAGGAVEGGPAAPGDGAEGRDLGVRETAMALGLLLVAAFGARLVFGLHTGLDGDEATTAFTALRITQGHLVLMEFNEHYQGALESYILAPFVWLLGPTELAVQVPLALVGSLYVLALYDLGHTIFRRRSAGLLLAGVGAVFPLFELVWSMKARSGYAETMVLAVVCLSLGSSHRVATTGEPGCATGSCWGWWPASGSGTTCSFSPSPLAACRPWPSSAADRRWGGREALRGRAGAAAGGALVGFSPWVADNPPTHLASLQNLPSTGRPIPHAVKGFVEQEAAGVRGHLLGVRQQHGDTVGCRIWPGRADRGGAVVAPQAPRPAAAGRPELGGTGGDGAGDRPRGGRRRDRGPVQRRALRAPLPPPPRHTPCPRRHPGPADGQVAWRLLATAIGIAYLVVASFTATVPPSMPCPHHHGRAHPARSDQIVSTSRRVMSPPSSPTTGSRGRSSTSAEGASTPPSTRADRVPLRAGGGRLVSQPGLAVRGRRSHRRHVRGADAQPRGDRHRDSAAGYELFDRTSPPRWPADRGLRRLTQGGLQPAATPGERGRPRRRRLTAAPGSPGGAPRGRRPTLRYAPPWPAMVARRRGSSRPSTTSRPRIRPRPGPSPGRGTPATR